MSQKNIFAVSAVDYNAQAKQNAENKGVYGKIVNTVSDYFLAALQLADYVGTADVSLGKGDDAEQFAKLLSESDFSLNDAITLTNTTIRYIHPLFGKVFHIWIRHDGVITVVYHVAENFDSEEEFDLIAWRDGRRLGELDPMDEEDRGHAIDWLYLAKYEAVDDNYQVIVPPNHPRATTVDENVEDKSMWSYWREKRADMAEALEMDYPKTLAASPELQKLVEQLKSTEAMINQIMQS